jgi:hypothetical protein
MCAHVEQYVIGNNLHTLGMSIFIYLYCIEIKMYKLILALTIITLTITTTIEMAQLSSVFAAAPPQGGNPHGDFDITSSTGDPHSSVASQGNPHLCETIEPGPIGEGGGGGKVVPKQC